MVPELDEAERGRLKQEIVQEVLATLRPPVDPAPEEIPQQIPVIAESKTDSRRSEQTIATWAERLQPQPPDTQPEPPQET